LWIIEYSSSSLNNVTSSKKSLVVLSRDAIDRILEC
jgi:hypothetical protein